MSLNNTTESGYKILADDADEEVVEIFIEEAVEILGELYEYLPKWQNDSDDEAALAVIRRSFHTLKGSGRLLGAEMIGEFSWKFENMLNRFIEGKISVSDEMNRALDEALAVLPQLIEQLKGNREPIENIAQLMTAADSLVYGEEVIFDEEEVSSLSKELIDVFLEEANELLEGCEKTLSDIKNQPENSEHVQKLQRNIHTLKGGARMASLAAIGDLTHNMESLVVMVGENKLEVNEVLFSLLHESLYVLTTMLTSVKKRRPIQDAFDLNKSIIGFMNGGIYEKKHVERFDVEIDDFSIATDRKNAGNDESVESKSQQRRKTDKKKPHWGERTTGVNFKERQEQVSVRADLLNNLVNYAGEVNIHHARMSKQVTDFGFSLADLTQTVIRLKEQLRELEIEAEIQIRSGYEKEPDNFDPLEMDQYSALQRLTRSLGETAGDVESINEMLIEITRDSEALLVQESRVSSDLQKGLIRTQMERFGDLSTRLHRIVKQVSRELDKEVELVIEGENNEVDRTVLDRIIAPLEHMLRNAVAHGIEKQDVRRVMGKKEVGIITLSISRQGSDIIISLKDDGAGIDVNKIRKKATTQGLIAEGVKLSDRDILQLILRSGFSTADEITQVAGRGVGMDVVDSEVKQLGGMLGMNTVQGKGTEFNVRLPLTLAINQALLVSVSDDVYAVPLSSIEGVVRKTGVELQRFYDSKNSHYDFNGVEYELKNLGALLTGNQPDYSKQLQLSPVVLVNVGDQNFALHVDGLLGKREIVVKPVGMQIGSVHGIAGATILADGRVVMILEMSALVVSGGLFRSEKLVKVIESPVTNQVKTVMVVDDSITIRKITERILKRHGIEVILVKDGVDATNQLRDHVPDLMLLDIEMPRMDGFEVASYVRNDERLKEIPIIMITSRTGSKHKEKAVGLGVNKYLGKPFHEDDLIRSINKILSASY